MSKGNGTTPTSTPVIIDRATAGSPTLRTEVQLAQASRKGVAHRLVSAALYNPWHLQGPAEPFGGAQIVLSQAGVHHVLQTRDLGAPSRDISVLADAHLAFVARAMVFGHALTHTQETAQLLAGLLGGHWTVRAEIGGSNYLHLQGQLGTNGFHMLLVAGNGTISATLVGVKADTALLALRAALVLGSTEIDQIAEADGTDVAEILAQASSLGLGPVMNGTVGLSLDAPAVDTVNGAREWLQSTPALLG